MATSFKIGSVKFHYLAGATAPATLNTASLYTTKFPECPGEWDPKMQTIDIEEPITGVNALVGSPVVKSLPEYVFTFKTSNELIKSLFYGGAAVSGNTDPTSVSVGTNFSNIGWGLVEEWNNGDTTTPSMVHAGFKCQLVPDGPVSRDPGKAEELKLRVRLIGQGTQRGIRSATGA